jgi:hypothetical protein
MMTQEQFNADMNLETRLRGSCLVVSVNIEMILMRIIYFSNAEQWDKPQSSPYLKIKKLTFGKKIDRTKGLMNKFHKDLLQSNGKLFKNLNLFKEIRNKIAHCAMLWIGDEQEKLEIYDVVELPNKFEFYVAKEYNYDELSLRVINMFKEIVGPLVSLQNEVERRLSQNYPELYSLLSGALGSGLKS